MKYLLAKDVGLACGSLVFHAIISTYFDLFSLRALSGQSSNDPPRYPDLLEHTKLLAHSAPVDPVDPVIEEPTQLPASETVPGTFAEAFAWFLKAS